MKLDKIINVDDEYYTPPYAIHPILSYIDPKLKIWCPFDTEESFFVRIFKSERRDVVYSHLEAGQDFFEYEPNDYDIIISNPPFSIKTKVFKRLYELDKPFAMILGFTSIFEGDDRHSLFKEKGCELMFFNKRISFLKSLSYPNLQYKPSPPFSSVYICKDVLPESIVFERLNKKLILI